MKIGGEKVDLENTELLIKDISPGGVRFLTNKKLPIKSNLILEFSIKILNERGMTVEKDTVQQRETFSSRLGIVAAAAGAAIGLGNIWMFPYLTGKNGGGAFIIVYLACVVVIGVPIMISEFIIGRKGQKNMVGSFRELAPRTPWYLSGWLGVTACFFILSFYGVVAGWSIEYVMKAVTNSFKGATPEQIGNMFDSFTSGGINPILWQIAFMSMTGWIVISGIKDGIEKFTKLAMPILFLIIIILDIRAITLPGSAEGLAFLFKPDWSLITPKVVLVALGTAFFSIGIGNGGMVTYGSYISKKENLGVTSMQVSFADTAVAILAGVAIFPAVFAFGVEPGAGPGLVFITLPNIFQHIPGGYFFAIIFFVLLAVAALTSSIATLEVVVAYFTEELKINRKKAAIIAVSGMILMGIPCNLSFGVMSDVMFFKKPFFDFIIWLVEAIFLPIGGLLAAVFVGWYMTKKEVKEELTAEGVNAGYFSIFLFLVKYIVPIAIGIVFLNGLGILKM